MTRRYSQSGFYKTALLLFLSLYFLSVAQACKPKVEDEKRDQMVSSFTRIKKVFCKNLPISEDRIMLSQRLISVGVNDDTRFQIQEELQKEFDIPVPFKFLASKETVGTVVRYTANYKGKKLSQLLAEEKKKSKQETQPKEKKETKDAAESKPSENGE